MDLTPREHYQKAQEWLEAASDADGAEPDGWVNTCLRFAQVHATLATVRPTTPASARMSPEELAAYRHATENMTLSELGLAEQDERPALRPVTDPDGED